MGIQPRMTLHTQLVLKVMLTDVNAERYGLEIARQAGLASGTIYPILARLEAAGWVSGGWERIDESKEGRRRRRYYQLTGVGEQEAAAALESTRSWMFPELLGATS